MIEVPVIPEVITKEFLLARNSQETYMQTYLGLQVKKGLFVNPLRDDHHPTASFYKNKKGDLIFHDFGSGFHGNFIKVVMEKYQLGYYEALRAIAQDFHYVAGTNLTIRREPPKIRKSDTEYKEKQDTSIQIEYQDFTKSDMEYWNSFGISEKTLRKYKVCSCKNVFLNGNYFTSYSTRNPAYGYYGGKKNNVELWRIYFPKQRNFRFLSNWNSKLIQGMWQLDRDANHVFITKSLKDTMLLHESGFNACAPNGETIVLQPQQYNRLRNLYSNIIVFYDNDKAGIENAIHYKEQYGCKCMIIKSEYAKDISDLYKAIGTCCFDDVRKELQEIVNGKVEDLQFFKFI